MVRKQERMWAAEIRIYRTLNEGRSSGGTGRPAGLKRDDGSTAGGKVRPVPGRQCERGIQNDRGRFCCHVTEKDSRAGGSQVSSGQDLRKTHHVSQSGLVQSESWIWSVSGDT